MVIDTVMNEPKIEDLGPISSMRGETMRVKKTGGKLGEEPRYYVISRVCLDGLDYFTTRFCGFVETMAPLNGHKVGEADTECLAFLLDNGVDKQPTNWVEVAGHIRNGATIEEIRQEVLDNDEL
jgi:hypothetical protein